MQARRRISTGSPRGIMHLIIGDKFRFGLNAKAWWWWGLVAADFADRLAGEGFMRFGLLGCCFGKDLS